MKSWHLTLLLILLITFLAFLRWNASQQTRQELIKACLGDLECTKEIKNVQEGQLELIKRETFRSNNNPAYNDLITLGAGGGVKPNQHIFIPKTHDSKHQ